MDNEELLSRIAVNPNVMCGKPAIRGTRLTVQYILKLLADGMTPEELLQEYDGLTREDISACLLYASSAVDDITFLPTVEENPA
jgi:uncharacterized protein (DUF433 family)